MLDQLLANWPLKALALVLAFGIWVSITGELDVINDVRVPLEVQLPETRILSSPPPNEVTVRLRGTESRMRRLSSSPMEMRVDLTDTSFGEQDILLSEANLSAVPPGVEVDFIYPDRLRLEVHQRARRELPVLPTFIGKLPDGYTFYGARVTPERVEVEGPEAEVEPLEQITTNAIRLDTRVQSFTVRVSAVPEAPHVRVVDPRPLEVRIDVNTAPVEQRFEDVPVELAAGSAGLTVSPTTVNVVLSGPRALIEGITVDQLRAVVETSQLGPDSLPADVQPIIEFMDVPLDDRPMISAKSIRPRKIAVRPAEGE